MEPLETLPGSSTSTVTRSSGANPTSASTAPWTASIRRAMSRAHADSSAG